MTDRPRAWPALLLCSLLTSSLWAQAPGVQPPEAEAPTALFDQQLGDVGVVVDAQGTWTTRLAAGWGEGISPQGVLPGLGYPGYDKGIVFTQVPDFTLTLRLLERYYLAVVFGGDLTDRTFEVGYNGKPGEAVQWVKAGNVPFTVPDRAGQSLAAGRKGAPAAAAAFSLGPVDTELLVRYEDGSRETKTYRGYQDTAVTTVGLDQWIRGRFFRLPGTGPFTGVRVLVSDPAGTFGTAGDQYRFAASDEVAIDPASGEIRLPAPASRRYLVTWDGAPASVTSAVLGITGAALAVPGSPGNLFVLAQPGSSSPFELRDRYPKPAGTTGAILLYDNDTAVPVPGFSVTQAADQDWFQVGAMAAEEAPFLGALSGTLDGLYPSASTPVPPPAAAVLTWSFRLPSSAATSYSLGTDVEPSSLAVVRNGLPTSAYQFDAGSGTLKFDGFVYDTDTIEISFQRKKTGAKASDLVLWQGGKWALDENQDLQWNLQGRWNLDQGGYTTEDLQSPGRMAASVAYQGAAGDWSWSVAVTGGALLADSTGHRRLYSQTNAGTQATLDGDSLRPSSAPGSLGGFSLTETNRAFAFFRDYWTNDPLTGQPQAGAWGTPGVDRQPRAAGGWTGPFLVRGDGTSTDRLAVADADLGPNQWTGLQIFLDKGKAVDLRSASTVTVHFRLPAGGQGVKVYFQAGALSENFDGSQAVRKIEYRAKPALAFLDQNAGQTEYFPVPEDSTWGNDAAGAGVPVPDGTLVTKEVTDNAGTGWQTAVLTLTDAERQALQGTTGWRLVVVNPNPTTVTVPVLAGPVVFEGSSWSVVPDGSTTGSVSPIEVDDPSWTDGHKLQVTWSARGAWTLQGRHNPVRPASFRTLAFRYRVDPGTGAVPLVLTVTDGSGHGLTASWTAADNGGTWVQARVDLKGGGVALDGTNTSAAVSLVPGAVDWDRLTLSYASGGPPTSGGLSVAEIEAVDPVWEPVGTSLASASWKQKSPWPSADFPLVSGLTLGLVSGQSGLTADDFAWKGRTTLAGTLGPVRASGEASFQTDSRTQRGHGAYQAVLPLGAQGGPTVELGDQFSDDGLRAERVAVGLPWVGTLETRAQASGPPATLVQDYHLGWTAPAQWPTGWTASVTTGWNQTLTDAPDLEGFGKQWMDSWAWLVPGPGTAPFALLTGDASAKGAWGPVSWALSAKDQVSQTAGPPVKWAPSGSWEAKFLLQPGGVDGWSLTPSLSRRVDGAFSPGSPFLPAGSAASALGWLWGTGGALGALPFAEWGQGSGPWDDGPGTFPSGTTQTVAGLDWTRPAVSDWTDLVVPLGLGTSLTGTRGRDGTADYRSGAAAFHAQARALNLFGALGSTPIFPWYRTDTLVWSATGAWGTGTRDQDKTAGSGLDLRADLILTPAESVGLPVLYKGQWGASPSQTFGLKPAWSLRNPADLPFELPRWLSPKGFRRMWVQDLSAGLDLGWDPTPSPVVRNLEISWKGRFLLSEKSEVSLTTKWGQQWQQNLYITGLLASLDLLLTF